MTTQEFSSSYDVLLNSYAQAASFGEEGSRASIQLNEYEKSVFLTEAQEELVLSLYTGRNSSGNSFDETEELRRYLSDLIEEAEISPLPPTSGKPKGIDSKSRFFQLPDDLWFITYEGISVSDDKCEGHTAQEVVPVTQDEYHRLKKNPFRGTNYRRALRLDLSGNRVEIVSDYTIDTYYVRYLKRLSPIILAPLDTESIRGKSTVTECELHESLHRRILDLAIENTLRSRGISLTRQTEK